MPENDKAKQVLAIKTSGLTKQYGSFIAVDALSFSVPQGMIYGLIGPNGSGKTTTVKMLCGLIQPTSGESYILGNKTPDKHSSQFTGYMPQETALYSDLTVHQNLSFFGRIFGLGLSEITEREEELLSFVELQNWRNCLVNKLSGGMQKRVSLICSLINNPRLLFLDEPTVGVDPELRATFWDYFHSLKKSGVTILITTHYMEEAGRCDLIGLMRNGKMISEGEPIEIVTKTSSTSLEEAFIKLSRVGTSK